MNAEQVIKEVEENASEYLEMVEDPSTLIVGILANKVSKLNQYIEYLEKRLEYVSRTN